MGSDLDLNDSRDRPRVSAKVVSRAEAVIALVGNPNTGKTTLFNRLTGRKQRVGNYPGVTVERRSGVAEIAGSRFEIVDLPGCYSLSAESEDERVVVDTLLGRIEGEPVPNLLVYVADSCNLTRNLYFASQLADLNVPMVVALNMSDEAKRKEIKISTAKLSDRLGVPVVATDSLHGTGFDLLKQEISNGIKEPKKFSPVSWPDEIQPVLDEVASALKQTEPSRGVAACALCGHLSGPDGQCVFVDPDSEGATALAEGRVKLAGVGVNPTHFESLCRYRWLEQMLEGVIEKPTENKMTATQRIDAVLTNRVFGLLVFVAAMFFVFQSIYTFAAPVMDLIDEAFATLGAWISPWLDPVPMFQSLAVDGIIAGVGSVVIFLPQILVLYFFIALLEDSGYMARAAFLMDRVFGWCGLNGKSFVPLLSSYACAVPGIMAARSISSTHARLITILTAPLMSCSARLPVYVLLIGAFIEPLYGPWLAALALFGFHLLGLFVAVPTAWLLHRFVVKGVNQPFLLEMPPYRWPSIRNVLWRLIDRGRSFLARAGGVIFVFAIIIWSMSYFPRSDASRAVLVEEFQNNIHFLSQDDREQAIERYLAGKQLEQSYLGQVGKAIQPVFALAGFDWKITVGIVASFPARELIIAALGIVYNVGGEVDEESAVLVRALKNAQSDDGSAVYTLPVVFAILVFFALCLQCGATVATISKESNWKWALFAFVYMTGLAWLGAVAVYQIGTAVS